MTLYRKYRPQTFKELVGQNHIQITLQNEIETNKVAQAYLFCGPRGVGKTTAARLLAKSVNCLNRKSGQSEPCNECEACQEITAGRSLDVMEIDAASHTGVDNVRENIIDNVRFTPIKRNFKVFIIDEVHMLSTAAFNALLKTLEEPPAHALFILATTEIHKVPATIISRSQRFDFKKINLSDLVQRLDFITTKEGSKVEKAVLEDIARFSEGCARDAETLLGQVLSLGKKEISQDEASLIIPRSDFNLVVELLDYLTAKNVSQALNLINKLVEEGVDLERFRDDLVEYLRRVLLVKIGSASNFLWGLSVEMEKKLLKQAQKIPVPYLTKMIRSFLIRGQEFKQTVIPQLPFELAIVELCQIQEYPVQIAKTKEKFAKTTASTVRKTNFAPENSASLTEITEVWPRILAKAQEYNHSLVSILKMARPLEVQENKLHLGFKYKFHVERLNEEKIHQTMTKVFAEILNKEIEVTGLLMDKEIPTSPANGASQESVKLQSVLKTFGGKIVN